MRKYSNEAVVDGRVSVCQTNQCGNNYRNLSLEHLYTSAMEAILTHRIMTVKVSDLAAYM